MTTADAIRDYQGRVMFTCKTCRDSLSADDFYEMGLRLPDYGEDFEDYCSAELIDEFEHPACLRKRSARAG